LLARVARFATRQGVLPFQPELITLTYEYPSELQLKAIRQVFQSPIASYYGSTEAGYVFMQCEHGRLHQNAEFCRVDLVPFGDGEPGTRREPATDGTRGELGQLAVTTFQNRWFPLLRFDIGDLGRLETAPCPCGRSFGMVLSAIEGRHRSACLGADGRLLTHRQIDHALAAIEGLCDYQLEQRSTRSVKLLLVADEGRARRSMSDASEIVRELFGRDIALEVAETAAILPEPSGKFLLVKRSFPIDWDRPAPAPPAPHGGSAHA
jgi:phenylacetate-CoA ligase